MMEVGMNGDREDLGRSRALRRHMGSLERQRADQAQAERKLDALLVRLYGHKGVPCVW